MARVPYLQHFTGDWLSDTRVSMLTAAARGIWIDVLSALHRSDSCTLTGTPDQLARVLRCLESEMQPAFNLFQVTRLADIEQRTANGLTFFIIKPLDVPNELTRIQRPSIPPSIRKRVLSVGCCVYCGSRENLTVDHIVPYSAGGAHSEENFQCLCFACNRAKSDKSEEDYFKELNDE